MFFLFVFASILAACKQEKFSIIIPLDGSLKSSSGTSNYSFSPDWSKYQKRRALRLHAGQFVDYRIEQQNFKEGAMKLWLKPDRIQEEDHGTLFFLKPSSSSPLLLAFDGPELIAERIDENTAVSTGKVLKPGRWICVAVTWNGESGLHIFVDGESRTNPEVNKEFFSDNLPSAGTLRIGLWNNSFHDENASVQIRDIELVNRTINESEVSQWFNQSIKQAPLVWTSSEVLHFVGSNIADADASNRQAWTGDTRIVYSAPMELPNSTDRYELVFRIKPEKELGPGTIVARVWTGANKIAEQSNLLGDFGKPEQYQDFVVPFHSNAREVHFELHSFAPNKHTFLLDMVTLRNNTSGWMKQWQTEELVRAMGALQEDEGASGGKAVGNDSTLFYGPYVCLGQPGKYRATWRVKIKSSIPPKTPVVLLDVFAHDGFFPGGRRGHKRYETLMLNSDRFQKRDQWESHSIEFRYDGADMMEFRAFARRLERGDVLLDTVTVEKL